MPLYYFHIRNGSAFERDPKGSELPDLETAHAEALICARELALAILDFEDDTRIEIADEAGQILLLVPFFEAKGLLQ
jgi:hypothetical protein